MSYLKKYIGKYWKLFLLAVSCLTLEALCDLMQPTIMSKIIDVGVKQKNLDYVLQMGITMLLITALGAASAVSRNVISSNVSYKFGADLRSDLFRKIQNFTFSNIDKFETASLVTRLTNDVTQVQNFVNGTMRIFVKAPLLCIGSIVMATMLNPKMALILVAAVPIVALLIFISIRLGYPYFRKVQAALDKVNGVMREYLAGVRVVKAFNRFSYEEERFSAANVDLSSVSITATRIMAIFSPTISLTVNLGVITVLWLGGQRINTGDLKVGQVIAFINYMTQILSSLMMISFVFNAFVRARASSERINEVMSLENNMKIVEKPAELADFKGKLDFEHVYFSYNGESDDPVLKDISLTCLPGETLGIIGSTGSGKSSLVNLIPRFYDPVSGKIKLDGIDIKELDIDKLRNRIAIVLQKTVLFTGTISDNIKWGKENASEAEVEAAAKIANIQDFIAALPDGYSTLLGQGGVNLSGGQKQRVSIASALVRNPEILILDDCTSAVDMATEANIRQALKKYSEKLTCIIIAQRITSVMDADRIIVLDDGEIAGLGTHEELMRSCGVYRDIYHSQIGREGI